MMVDIKMTTPKFSEKILKTISETYLVPVYAMFISRVTIFFTLCFQRTDVIIELLTIFNFQYK